MLQNVGLADSHTHSRCSLLTAASRCAPWVRRRSGKGLRCLTVTDHYDCNCFDLPILLGTASPPSQETVECAQAMQGRLTVLFGAELGQLQAPAAAEAVLAAAKYDFILGSLHNVAGYPDFYDIDYAAYDCKVLFTRYFAELRK